MTIVNEVWRMESINVTDVLQLWRPNTPSNDNILFNIWEVERLEGSNMLKQPIVFPVDDNWNLCW